MTANYIMVETMYGYETLARMVNEKMDKGYVPLGEPFKDDIFYLQAMVKCQTPSLPEACGIKESKE